MVAKEVCAMDYVGEIAISPSLTFKVTYIVSIGNF